MIKKFLAPNRVILYLSFLLLIGLEHIQLNISVISFSQLLDINKYVNAFGYLALATFALLLICIFSDKKWRIAMGISTLLVSVWSLIGVYVLKFHESPLFLSELKNVKTAVTVAGNYEIIIYKNALTIIVLFILEVAVLVFSYFMEKRLCFAKNREAKERVWTGRFQVAGVFALTLLLCAGIFRKCYSGGLIVLFSDNAAETTAISGYEAMFLQDAYSLANPILKPDGYDVNYITVASTENDVIDSESVAVFPDIIFIINESFSDPRVYADFQTDVDFLEDFYDIEGATYGYSISPSTGGGTNNTEYEILTSNSIALFPMGAPFNYMKMDESESNAVKYLKNLGYTTSAFHCYSATNYSRDTGYVDIGFDNIYLGPEAFSYQNSNGNRLWLDEDNYQDLIDKYNAREEDGPQFMYMLTYQNHGGWTQNDAELDTVHTTGIEDQETASEMDEYLSSVQLSAEAFKELTEYFSTVDRNVIIVMTGDHAGCMDLDAESYQNMEYAKQQIVEKMVPYVIWSNYETYYTDDGQYATMTELMPITLKTAGLSITPYYEELLEIREELPVITTSGAYLDKNGQYGMIDDNPEYKELYSQYLYEEYNGLSDIDDLIGELFE